MIDLEDARERMVQRQVARRGVRDERVLEALRRTPRELFVPEDLREFAYDDSPLPIEAGQTISQPYIVGLMAAAARIEPQDHVLEVGTGSGYAAAVLARLAERLHTVERHDALARTARERLAQLRLANVEVHLGDGTHGWPEAAPYDAILVAAGGPAIPQALKDQLDLGGRLVMPVGERRGDQRLIRVTRTSANHFEEDDLGGVTFVPLIGEHGWSDDRLDRRPAEARSFRPAAPGRTTASLIAEAAEHLPDFDDPAFGALFDRFADRRVVLLGESSHGASEFYIARAAITRRLVEAHGYSIVALEADWPDAASLDRLVRGRPARRNAEPAFQRFPTWMWRNQAFDDFTAWLTRWNAGLPEADRAGIYGLDLYNLSASLRAVLDYLDRVDPEAAAIARERYGCLTPWASEPHAYGRMARSTGYARCEAGVVKTLVDLLRRQFDYAVHDGDDFLDAAANARLVRNAEAYYRALYYGAAESWNLRDTHMFETLEAILQARGPKAKAVVWAHNSHVGDASKTEMGLSRDQLNLGQLCRERFGEAAALIGFGTNTGTVACASDWDGPLEEKRVRPALPGSYEHLAHDSGVKRFLLDLREGKHTDLRHRLLEPKLERFIGVIYRPETERWSHYSVCSLPQQFDAYVWFDETRAVTSTAVKSGSGEDDLFPTGL
jgi:protein-L-isoaspartate(D-aspartate) O-methyltransferase